jgi:hypothetical protein
VDHDLSLIDFCNRTKIVRRGGVVVRCHPPTVETMHLFLLVYAAEIMAASKMVYQLDMSLGEDPVKTMLPLFTRDRERAVTVLETCCETPRGVLLEDAVKADGRIVDDLAEAVMSLTDVNRILGSLCLKAALAVADAPEDLPEAMPEEGPSPQELAVVALAQRFHIDPSAICSWPYERFLAVWDCIYELNKQEREAAGVEEEFNDWAVREIESRG